MNTINKVECYEVIPGSNYKSEWKDCPLRGMGNEFSSVQHCPILGHVCIDNKQGRFVVTKDVYEYMVKHGQGENWTNLRKSTFDLLVHCAHHKLIGKPLTKSQIMDYVDGYMKPKLEEEANFFNANNMYANKYIEVV